MLHEDPLWVAACPTLLGTFRRSHTAGMQSKVHPTDKTQYRVANWPAYNQALVRRGDVTAASAVTRAISRGDRMRRNLPVLLVGGAATGHRRSESHTCCKR